MNSKTKMQLRTNRKLKTTEFDDLGFEEKPAKSHKKYNPRKRAFIRRSKKFMI